MADYDGDSDCSDGDDEEGHVVDLDVEILSLEGEIRLLENRIAADERLAANAAQDGKFVFHAAIA